MWYIMKLKICTRRWRIGIQCWERSLLASTWRPWSKNKTWKNSMEVCAKWNIENKKRANTEKISCERDRVKSQVSGGVGGATIKGTRTYTHRVDFWSAKDKILALPRVFMPRDVWKIVTASNVLIEHTAATDFCSKRSRRGRNAKNKKKRRQSTHTLRTKLGNTSTTGIVLGLCLWNAAREISRGWNSWWSWWGGIWPTRNTWKKNHSKNSTEENTRNEESGEKRTRVPL